MDPTECRHGAARAGSILGVEGADVRRVVEGGAHSPTVIVVGAGVSGCACAAELASAGLQVTLINSAMDRVGLPAYGPDMIGEGRGHQAEEALRGLPLPLRSVWLQAAMMPASGEAILNVDRRKISIETKRALEEIPGLGFRQGFVTDLRLVGRRVEVETVFGEVFEADAVVVAVGLSLGGRIDTGSEAARGGRYGEPDSAGLRAALETMGVEFRETSLEVGPLVSVRSARACGWLADPDRPETEGTDRSRGDHAGQLVSSGHGIGGRSREEPLLPAISATPGDCWPDEYPPAPHWQADLRVDRMVMMWGTGVGAGATRLPALSPDGAAISELYLAPESEFADEMNAVSVDGEGRMASRMHMTVTGLTVAGMGDTGRVRCSGEPGPVWVVGRSAGAQNYAASLSSGVRAALDIARSLAEPAAGQIAADTSAISEEPGQGSGT